MVVADGIIKIKINDNIFKLIRPYCQIAKGMSEAGGILIGRENISNDNLIIEAISEPMAGDKKTRTRFIRQDQGHVSFFQKKYNESNGTIRYVGEWHTHPEDIPHYSVIDLNNWKRIKRESRDVKDQYHLIAGRKAIVLWKYSNEKLCPIKILSYAWDDIIMKIATKEG